MDTISKADLLKAQQGEINAVILYKKIAERIAKDNPKIHEKFMSLASDEGKHGETLRSIVKELYG